MTGDYVTALEESLNKKLKILEETDVIAKAQAKLLAQDALDYEAFDELMNDRDICLEQLEKLDEGFELVYERVKDELNANREAYASQIKSMQSLITRITELTTSITAQDERNKAAVGNAFIKDRRGIAEGRRSVSVAMNYYKNMNAIGGGDSRFSMKK